MFPSTPHGLPDELAQVLFHMSSVLPDLFYRNAVAEGFPLQPGAAAWRSMRTWWSWSSFWTWARGPRCSCADPRTTDDSAMFFEHRAFWLPKDVQDPNAYEDAFEVDRVRGWRRSATGFRPAFPRPLGRDPGQGHVADPPDVATSGAGSLAEADREALVATVDESTLAWHQKPKTAGRSRHHAAVDRTVPPGPPTAIARPFRLRAYSIGDCCLFHVRGGQSCRPFRSRTARGSRAIPR